MEKKVYEIIDWNSDELQTLVEQALTSPSKEVTPHFTIVYETPTEPEREAATIKAYNSFRQLLENAEKSSLEPEKADSGEIKHVMRYTLLPGALRQEKDEFARMAIISAKQFYDDIPADLGIKAYFVS